MLSQKNNPNGVDKPSHWGYHNNMKNNKLITVVETAEFIKQAEKFMSDQNRREFISYTQTDSNNRF